MSDFPPNTRFNSDVAIAWFSSAWTTIEPFLLGSSQMWITLQIDLDTRNHVQL